MKDYEPYYEWLHVTTSDYQQDYKWLEVTTSQAIIKMQH